MSSGTKTGSLKTARKSFLPSSKKSRAHKKTARAFLKRFCDNLKKQRLLPPDSKILVAVSGGPDSMALLFCLAHLRKRLSWQLAVAHINYGLRGQESALDQALVKETSEKLGLPLFILRKRLAPKTSEEKLRTIRYDFFNGLVKKHGFHAVALAHHQDDQAETVLLRLIRGSGSTGLAAMKPKRGVYVRPFLTVPKNEILDFLQEKSLPYRLDKSNADPFYLRNRVRHELLPLLETFNPKIKKVLRKTAETFQEESLESKKKYPEGKKSAPSFKLSRNKWVGLSLAEKRVFVRELFRERGLSSPTKSFTDTLISDFSNNQKAAFAKEYARLRVGRKGDTIHIHFKEIG